MPAALAAVETAGAGGEPDSAAPQVSQNLAPGRPSAPHEAHCGCIEAPQPSQKRAVSRLSAPHVENRIGPPVIRPLLSAYLARSHASAAATSASTPVVSVGSISGANNGE